MSTNLDELTDHIAQISRRMSISAFEKTRDKMRAKCGLAVSPRRSNKKNLSDMMLKPSSNMKRSNSSSSVVSSTTSSVVSTSPGNGGGTTSQSDKHVIYKSPSQITTMQSTIHQPVMQSANSSRSVHSPTSSNTIFRSNSSSNNRANSQCKQS